MSKNPCIETNFDTTPVRKEFAFAESALAAWMGENVDGFEGPFQVEQFKGGQSNPTYKLVTPDRSYVVRRKPPRRTLKGAHAVDCEAKLLTGLAKVDFPVARVHGLCTDEQVIESMFYVMDLIDCEAVGLGDFGKPGNFFTRQIARWSRQYFEDAKAGCDANMDRLIDWLNTHMPDDDHAISVIHGDFRIDNMIFHPTELRVLSVLD